MRRLKVVRNLSAYFFFFGFALGFAFGLAAIPFAKPTPISFMRHKLRTGILSKGYLVKMKDGSDYEVKMRNLMGMRLTAYYVTESKKDANGEKVKTYEVFKIRFLPKDK